MATVDSHPFTLVLPSDTKGDESNTSDSYTVTLPHEITLDNEKDWYVGLQEAFLPLNKRKRDTVSGTIIFHPTVVNLKSGKAIPKTPVVRTTYFHPRDLHASPNRREIFHSGSMTRSALSYLNKRLREGRTVNDAWLIEMIKQSTYQPLGQIMITHKFEIEDMNPSDAKENYSNYYDYSFGHLEFSGYFTSLFKLPRFVHVQRKPVEELADYISIKNLITDKEYDVKLPEAVVEGQMPMIQNQLDLISDLDVKLMTHNWATLPTDKPRDLTH